MSRKTQLSINESQCLFKEKASLLFISSKKRKEKEMSFIVPQSFASCHKVEKSNNVGNISATHHRHRPRDVLKPKLDHHSNRA